MKWSVHVLCVCVCFYQFLWYSRKVTFDVYLWVIKYHTH